MFRKTFKQKINIKTAVMTTKCGHQRKLTASTHDAESWNISETFELISSHELESNHDARCLCDAVINVS